MDGPTVAVLYPGEMGAALARILRRRDIRVITTLAGRSGRTATLSREAGMEEVRSLAEVARQADVVLSVVPPGAAEGVAEQYVEHAGSVPAGAVYVDVNSIGPELAVRLADRVRAAGLDFVDAAIHGQARALTSGSGAVLYLAGTRAGDVGELLADAVAVEVVGNEPGTASSTKMLLAGVSKGLCALFLETAVLAERWDMLPGFVSAVDRFYPDLMVAVRRMLPSYPQHAARRAFEMREVERTARAVGQVPRLLAAVPQLLEDMADMPFERTPPDGWTAGSLAQHLVARGFLARPPRTAALETALTQGRT